METMTSKYFVGLVTGLALVGTAVGCGDDTSGAGGGGGGTGGDPSTTTTSVTVTSTSTGTATGDGNESIETAVEMDTNQGVQFAEGDLADGGDPSTDVDYFKFTITTAGAYLIGSDAKPDEDPYADGYADLVVALHDESGQKLAENDDPFPRDTQDASFYVKLEPGTYYLSVTEYCTTSTSCPAGYFDDIDDFSYLVFVSAPFDTAEVGILEESTPDAGNDTNDTAAAWEFEPLPPTPPAIDPTGRFYFSLAYGDFPSAADRDGYLFTVPATATVSNGGRLNISLASPPSGLAGNGSSRKPGLIEIVDVTANEVVARFDYGAESDEVTEREEPFVPVVVGQQYLVRIGDGGAAAGGTLGNYYFLLGGVTEGNPLEAEEMTNDVVTTPETLTSSPNSAGGIGYFIDGDMAVAGTDVDHYEIAVPSPLGGQRLYVYCISQRIGSGLVGLKATVHDSTGAPITGATGTESATEAVLIEEVDPGSNTTLIVKMEAASQASGVAGTHYRCGYNFIVPQP
jgi:hypothetical protein